MYRRYIPLVAFSWVEENTHWDKRILFSSLLSPHFNCSGTCWKGLQFQKISIQFVLSVYVGLINVFDSGFFCHTYNKIFFSYVHSQTKNYAIWDPFHHNRRFHNAAGNHSPFFIIFMALFFDQSRSFLFS